MDYCKVTIPEGWTKNCNTGIFVTDVGGGKSFDLKYGRRSYSMVILGLETAKADALLIDKFAMQDNTTIAGTSFTRYYLIVKYATNDYEEFTDASNARREYCKGVIVPKVTIKFSRKDSLNRKISFGWRSVW